MKQGKDRRAEIWREQLNMQRHPEGGSFARTYLCDLKMPEEVLPAGFSGERPFASATYFLLEGKEFSAIHRLKQDELWHFYDGTSILIHIIHMDGRYEEIRLGRNIEMGERPMGLVPAHSFFGAELADTSSFALVGCTLSPAFDFDDFWMPARTELLKMFPQHEELIGRLTRH